MVQIIGCILVVFGHSFPFVSETPDIVEGTKGFVYSFHMPLFIWCSGFLFSYSKQTDRKTFKEYLKQRSIKLLIPYFALSFIGVVPKYLCSPVLNDSLSWDPLSLLRAFFVPRANIWGHFWFLPMIFILGVIAFIIEKGNNLQFRQLRLWCLILPIAFMLSFVKIDALEWFGITDVFMYAWFFVLGIIFGIVYNSDKWPRRWFGKFCGGGYFVVSISLFMLNINDALITYVHNYIIALLMIACVVSLCISVKEKIKINRSSLIAQTYQIFILSWPCQLIVEILLERILHLQWWIIIPMSFLIGICMPLVLLKLINLIESKMDTKILSHIIGK